MRQAAMFPGCFSRPILGTKYRQNCRGFQHISRKAGPGHVSGYHMAVVAGIMFFALRALFALMPAFDNRHPIKN
jgi:hypothetical protein